jgi:dCTP deaminase
MGILTKADILKRVKAKPPLIENFHSESLKSASYDLHLGNEFLKGGSYFKLDEKHNPYLEIPAHDVVVVCTEEKVNIPNDLVARFGLRFSLVMKGLVLNNEPQIDPGYQGRLFCLLYNLTDRSITLTYRQPFATIEFETTTTSTDRYTGQYQNAEHTSDVVKELLPRSGLKELSDNFRKMEKELTKKVDRFYTLFFTIITIVLAILGLIITRILFGS